MAGNGAIIDAVGRRDVGWVANELDARRRGALCPRADVVRIGDYRTCPHFHADVLITNPAFSLATGFVPWALTRARIVVLLLRLNFLASAKRAPFFHEHPPSLYVLPNRPDFTGDGGDMTEYAWFAWGLGPPAVQVLATTPKDVRKAAKLLAREQGRLIGGIH